MVSVRKLICILILGAVAACAAPPPKVVLVAGPRSHAPGEHEYNAGCYLLQKFLRQNGIKDVVVVTGGWPEDEHVFDGAGAIVLYMDGGSGHPALKGDRMETLGKLMKKGVGLVCLHYALEVPKDPSGEQLLDWIGGYYERPYSTNPMNEPALTQASPKHPISRGWKSFQLKDEWYYRIRFREGDRRVTPILTAMLPKEAPEKQVLAWAIEREDGGRGFGFTGLHPHQNWNVPELRTLLVNAVLWTAKWNIPGEGAKCDLAGGDLGKNLFPVANN